MVGVKAFITRDDELLLVKSGFDREELWEVPGGRYDVGEEKLSPQEILRREISEELGNKFECEIQNPIITWIRPLGDQFVFLIAYAAAFAKGDILLSNEHTEYRWVTKDSWQDLPLAPGYDRALDQFWKKR